MLTLSNGDVYACGDNFLNCLGIAPSNQGIVFTFTKVALPAPCKKALCNYGLSVFLMQDSTLYTSGRWASSTPIHAPTLDTAIGGNIIDVALGGQQDGHHVLVLKDTGAGVFMQGRGGNHMGQLGVGNITNRFTAWTEDWEHPGIAGAVKVFAAPISGAHSGLIMSDGSVKMCGRSDIGQQGDGKSGNILTFLPINGIQWATNKIKDMSLTFNASMLVAENGAVFVSGDNTVGQLGVGHRNRVTSFTKVVALNSNKIVKVSTANSHSLMLAEDGKVFACGGDNTASFYNYGAAHSNTPVDITTAIAPDAVPIYDIAVGGAGFGGQGYSVAALVPDIVRSTGWQNGALGQSAVGNKNTWLDADSFLPLPDGKPMPEEYLTNWPTYGEFLKAFEEATPGLKDWAGAMTFRTRLYTNSAVTSGNYGLCNCCLASKDEVVLAFKNSNSTVRSLVLSTFNFISGVETDEFYADSAALAVAFPSLSTVALKSGKMLVLPFNLSARTAALYGIYDPSKPVGSRFTDLSADFQGLKDALYPGSNKGVNGCIGVALPSGRALLIPASSNASVPSRLAFADLDGDVVTLTPSTALPTAVNAGMHVGASLSLDSRYVYVVGGFAQGLLTIDLLNPNAPVVTFAASTIINGQITWPRGLLVGSDNTLTVHTINTDLATIKASDVNTPLVTYDLPIANTQFSGVRQVSSRGGVFTPSNGGATMTSAIASVFNDLRGFSAVNGPAGAQYVGGMNAGTIFRGDDIIIFRPRQVLVLTLSGIGKPHPSWQLHPYMNHS
jgi:alpha-tubulin suppressor-like RCC1 family protein